MDKTLNVFILAAGLGERLMPITEHIPKPLLPILGKPVLQIILERVSALPANKIGINLYHKKDTIERWVKQYSDENYPSPIPLPQGEGARGRVKNVFPCGEIRLFPEESALGTGGALKNAEQFLSEDTFFVHNSDIVSDIDLERLLEFHISSKNIVTLAVHDFPEFNNVVIDKKGYLKRIEKIIPPRPPLPKGLGSRCCEALQREAGGFERLAFTGIAIYEPEFLKFLPADASSIVDAWLNAVAAGYKIGTLNVSGCSWSDIGTPSAYASTVFEALRADGEMIYIHPSVKGCKDVELNGYVVIEKECKIGKGVSLRNCITLPGSSVTNLLKDDEDYPSPTPLPQGEGVRGRVRGMFSFENCILGSDFKIDLNESEILGLPKEEPVLIGTGGSDRKYYRIKKDKKSSVLMQCIDGDPDFQRHIEYTRFFLKYSIPVPVLIEIETDKMRAIFEDLGDISLYSWLKCPREKKQIEEIYRKVIDILIRLHTVVTERVSDCPILQDRVFNYEDFRWETDYFIERFVMGIRNIKIKNLSALSKEFHRLALKMNSFLKTVIHRDFQSQNIMITRGGTPRLIDYQGARMGPPTYDVVSILWDPYYYLGDEVRERLLDYYISKMRKIPTESLLPCRLQRHMQALGAYGFLFAVKGKKYFLKYVPEGLRLLKEDVTLSKAEYPELYKLVMRL
jgi:NDP-sugar pyrophosphorylase family protein/aminoglycoside/choline kinase family phosphotransferase